MSIIRVPTMYTWGKYTVSGSAKGTFIENVQSANTNAYPNSGAQDGYWYVRKYVTFNKYNVTSSYVNTQGSDTDKTFMTGTQLYNSSGYTTNSNTYNLSSPAQTYAGDIQIGQYIVGDGTVWYGTNLYSIYNKESISGGSYQKLYLHSYTLVLTYSRGSYIGTVTADYDAYPADGVQSGYWYVRQ